MAPPSEDTGSTSAAFFEGIAKDRARITALGFFGLAFFGLGALPLLSPRPLMLVVLAAALVLICVTAGSLLVRRSLYEPLVFVGFVSSVPIMYALDVNGPIEGIVVMLLILNNLHASRVWAVATTFTTAALHLSVHALLFLGVLSRGTLLDVSLAPDPMLPLSVVGTHVVLYSLSVLFPILYRRGTSAHLHDLTEAGREIAAHDALLREARVELDRVAAIGLRGRFTDQRLGSFVLGPILGRGGMGEIYEATHVANGSKAAVKLLRALRTEAADALPRFLRESAIAFALESKRIVKLLEVGGMEAPLPFLALERLEGEDLKTILARDTKLPPREVAELVAEVAEGLLVAKRHGVVHRDIKPSNLFRTAGGWKILDFGIARSAGQSGTLTGAGLVGTLGFIAPEQLDGTNEVTHRTDVHALAAVAYRALTGRAAFVEREPAGVLREVQLELPPRPSSLAAIHPALDDVLRIALAKAPADRFADAQELAMAFAAAVDGEISLSLREKAATLLRTLAWSEARDSIKTKHARGRKRPSYRTMTAAAPAPSNEEATETVQPPSDPTPLAVESTTKRTLSLIGDIDEVARVLRLSRVRTVVPLLIALVVFGLTQLAYQPSARMRTLGIATLLALGVELAALIAITRETSAVSLRRYDAVAILALFTSTGIIYQFQVYGIVAAFLAVALLLFSLGATTRVAAIAMLAVALPHAAMSLAVTFGLPYEGVFGMNVGKAARLWNLAHALGLYALAFLLARIFNERFRRTLREIASTFRLLAEREALLRDARLELERVVGVGQPGRFTGQQLGRFVLGVVLGRGGMGEVYAAKDGDRSAAVKVMRTPFGGEGETAIERFAREARISESLHSPHVVEVLAVGEEGGLPYLAMEHLEGADLALLLQQSLVIPPAVVVDLVTQIAKGLAAAHAAGITHRDIKPSNLFRTSKGVWKLMDFGIAMQAGETAMTNVAGTPAYMAPEQLTKDGTSDARTDVYALAVVAYRALTGRPAFSGRDGSAVIERVLRGTPESPSEVADLPVAVDAVILRGMTRASKDRYPSATAFAEALRASLI